MNGLKQLLERFRALQPREQWLVGVGAIVVVVTLLYLIVWEPVMLARDARAAALADARALASRLEAIGAQLQQSSHGGAAVNRNQSLLAVIDQTSRTALQGKAPSRIQPEGDQKARVWLEDATFNDVLTWLSDLQKTYGIRLESATIERHGAPGQVSAQLALERGA